MIAVREKEPFGHNAKYAPRIIKALWHLVYDGDIGRDRPGSSRNAAWYQRRPNWLSKATASSGPGATTGCRPPAQPRRGNPAGPGTHPAGAEKPALVHRAKTVPSDIIGKDASQEKGEVTEAAQDARPFGLRDDIEQPSQADGVQLREPLPAKASAGGDDDGPARHTGVGSQQLSQEEATPGRGHEVA